MTTRNIAICFFMFIVSYSLIAREDYRSKLGIEVKGLKTNLSSECGWVIGLKANRFLGKSNVHLGIGAYYGSPSGGKISDENLYYAGFLFGYDGRISHNVLFETAIVLGYGRGVIKERQIDETSYFVAEPNLGLGFGLGKGWRMLFVISYQHFSRADHFSGIAFGVRVDERTETTIKPIEP